MTGASQGLGQADRRASWPPTVRPSSVRGPQRREAGRDGGHDRWPPGGKAEAISCDVKDGAKVDQLVESVVAKWERLDILVNNAGHHARHAAAAA